MIILLKIIGKSDIIPFSTLEMTSKAGIPWKIRKFRLFLWLKMLYIFSNLNIFYHPV